MWDYVTTIYLFYVSNAYICVYMGFPGGASGKEPTRQCRMQFMGLQRIGHDWTTEPPPQQTFLRVLGGWEIQDPWG